MPHFLDLISPHVHHVGSDQFRTWIGPTRVIYDQELLFVVKGECMTRIDGHPPITIPANSFIIKPGGLRHSSIKTSSEPIHFRWVHFDWTHTEPTLSEADPYVCYYPAAPNPRLVRPAPDFIPASILHGPIPSPASTFQLFERLQERWHLGTTRERASCRALLMEMLIDLLGNTTGYLPPIVAPENSRHHLAQRMRDILTRMLDDPRTARRPLEEELGKLGCSYPHLCRVFTHNYGVSPLTFFNSMRLERARLLLRDTATPINEIALMNGFANAAYFTRLFTKYAGKSPRAFRQARGR